MITTKSCCARLSAGILAAAMAAICLPTSSFAGGSPATGALTDQLVMMGGAQSPASTGDYISATDGLNNVFRFYIEVPSGQTDLQVDLYDADILNNVNDELQERDRNRDLEETSVRYQLFDPSGALVASRFNYGDGTSPINSHGLWKNFYNNRSAAITGGDTFADTFSVQAYTNNNGTQNFAAAWVETADLGGGGATGGAILVTPAGRLRVSNAGDPSPFTNQPTIHREVNLSAYTNATVSFDYTSGIGVDLLSLAGVSGDSIAFEVSPNGGTTYYILEEFADISGAVSGSRTYDVTDYISTNTRFRFHITMRYAAADEYVDFDNFTVRGTTSANGASPANGHWQLVVDMSNRVNSDQDRAATLRDDVNAFGLRAHDGTPGAGGTEYNVYAETFTIVGINRNNGSRTYRYYPWVTAGCNLRTHDFDYDADLAPEGPPNPQVSPYGAWSLTSRSGLFSASSTTMSNNNTWRSQTVGSWTTQAQAVDYGIWTWNVRIDDNGPGNYAPIYLTYNADGGEPPPTSNPENGANRLYLPTDANVAPIKPYLRQYLTYVNQSPGPNPPVVGVTSRFAVSVVVTNPTGSMGPITFSNANPVTANVPGGQVVYGGFDSATQGTIVSQPALGGSGDVVWNPGTVAAGTTATLVYFVDVTLTSPVDVNATGAFNSGNGTRARYVDETANSTQARATFTLGELCGLQVDADSLTPALVASFEASATPGGGRLLEWRTAAEAGTVSFELYRERNGQTRKLHAEPLFAQLDAPQGGIYRFHEKDGAGAPGLYWLRELSGDGRDTWYGPYTAGDRDSLSSGPRHSAAAPGSVFAAERRPADTLDQARRRDAARYALAAAPAALAAGGSQLEIAIDQPAFYRLSVAELAQRFGLTAKQVRSRLTDRLFDLRLGGQPVAWTSFDGEGLDFWGEASESPFYAANTYVLALGPGETIGARRARYPQQAQGLATTRETWRQEKDQRPVVLMSLDPESDLFFWDFLQSGANATKNFSLQIPDPDPAGSAARLWLDLRGAAAGQHRLEVRVNGLLVGQVAALDREPARASVVVPASALASGANTVQLSLVGGSLVFVDGFDVVYDRALVAQGDLLASASSGARFAMAGGFGRADVKVFDLSVPNRPQAVERLQVSPEGGAFRAVWENGRAGGRFVALTPAALRSPAAIAGDLPSDLRAPQNGAELLIVAPDVLLEAAQAYGAARQAQGIDTLVAALDDVYDEFAASQRDPRALRDFLAYAAGRWQHPPSAVLLIGNGSYDHRNALGYGDNLLPTLLVDRGGSLFPSDTAYADVAGSGVPTMAIGRVPALSPAEVEAYAAKVATYESAAGPWQNELLMVADRNDATKNFAAFSDQLAALVPAGFARTPVHLGAEPDLAAARQKLLGGLASGAALVDYVGHGGVDRLSSQGLLTKADAAGLANGDRLPVLTAVSCHINLHGLPGFDSLGEDLLLNPAGGMAGVFAPAWLSEHDEAALVGDRLIRALFGGATTLGEAAQQALRGALDAGIPRRSLVSYQLLGDPTLRLRLVAEPPSPAPCAPDCGQG